MKIEDLKERFGKTDKFSIKETMQALEIKSHNTLNKYVSLGMLTKHMRTTGKPFFKGIEIVNFSNSVIF